MVVGVEAGENGRPRGTTQRVAGEGVVEGGSVFHQQGAQLRQLPGRGRVQIVGKDEDYVGSSGSFSLSGRFESSGPEQPTAKKTIRHARTMKGAPITRNPLTLLSAIARIIRVLRALQALHQKSESNIRNGSSTLSSIEPSDF